MRLLIAGSLAATTVAATTRFSAVRATIEQVHTGEDALHLARHDSFDAVIFDAILSDMTGVQLIRKLRDARCTTPAIAIARNILGAERAKLLDLGADDVIAQTADGEEVAARIRAVVRRVAGHTQSALRWGPLALHLERRELSVNGEALHLSPNEFRVLQVLLLRKGSLVRKAALLDALYSDPDDSEIKSIDVLMHRLRKRLMAAGADGLITTVWGSGYIVREPAEKIAVPQAATAAVQRIGGAVAVH